MMAPCAACGGTHPPRAAEITEAQKWAERLVDALLDGTDGAGWAPALTELIHASGAGNAALVGNALRVEARLRLQDLEESQRAFFGGPDQ